MKKILLHEATLFGLVIWTLSSVMGQPIVNGFMIGAVGSGLYVFVQKKMKQQSATMDVWQLERDLPYALLELDVLLSLHWPFEQAVSECMEQNPTNFFWKKVQSCWGKSSGATIHALQALEQEVMLTNSVLLSQAVSHLQFIYLQAGKKTSELGLKAMASHALHQQRLNQQAFSKKLSFYAVIFVAVSTIVPTLLQSFLLMGNIFLDFSIEPHVILLLLVGLIPLLNAGLLLFIYQQQQMVMM